MAYLDVIDEPDATGELAEEYEAARIRAGKVMNILKAMSFRPRVLRAFLELNREINFAESPLERMDRELLAVVVSVANGTRYSTHAHVELLRAEGADETLVRYALGDEASAPIDPGRRALCDFAAKLTKRPAEIALADVDTLRKHGFDDVAIHDVIQVIAFFNYVNRVVNAIGVDDEPEWADAGPSFGTRDA